MMNAGEKAMALVDGQLSPVEVPALVQELARNAALVAELQGYLAISRSRIAHAYAPKTDERVPRRLIDAVMETPVAAKTPRSAAPASPLDRLVDWLRGSYRVPAWSLAAAPVLAAATAFAVAVAIPPVGRDAPPASTDLGAALERTASGKDTALATVRPMLSFNSKDAGWCRQFEVVRSARKETSHGLACRGRGGDWRVVASTAPSAASRYTPAGAQRRKMIDDLVTSMIVGEPLSVEREAAVMGKAWQL